jgi:ferritin
MLKENILKALNDQMVMEYHAAYIYLGMSAYFDSEGLPGFASWMRIQSQEEVSHGDKIYQYILDKGEVPALADIAAVTSQYESVLDAFEKGLEHEEKVTASIDNIASITLKDMDHATYQFIQWYVEEQVEEEASFGLVVQRLQLIGANKAAFIPMDHEMSKRKAD